MGRVGTEVCDLPTYENLPNLESFLTEFEEKLSKSQCLLAMDFALKTTPAIWWIAHKLNILGWSQCQRLMGVLFG